MARVDLTWREVRDDTFPDLCVRCGAEASERVHKTFRWWPWWQPPVAVLVGVLAPKPYVLALMVVGIIPLVGWLRDAYSTTFVLSLLTVGGIIPLVGRLLYRTVLSRLATPAEMLVRVPVCPAHRNHWRWRWQVVWSGLIALVVLWAVKEMLLSRFGRSLLPATWISQREWFYVGLGVGFLLWLGGVIVLHLTSVRAARISTAGIVLRGVAATFAEEHHRERVEPPLPKRRKKGPAPEAEPIPLTAELRFRVVASPHEGSEAKHIDAVFDHGQQARDYAELLRDTGKYQEVRVQKTFAPGGPHQKHPIVESLKQASAGLLFPGESAAPLKPFLWEGDGGTLTPDHVCELAGAEEGTGVEEASLDDLLESVPSEDGPAFQKLAGVIRQQLSGVKVYKVGDEAERDVYIVGKTSDGQLAGLKTKVVET
jgi:hypothetical protein